MPPTVPEIAIRPFHYTDAEELNAAVKESNAAVSPWLPDFRHALSLPGTRAWLGLQAQARAEGSAYHFAVVEAPDGSLLGAGGLSQVNRRHRFANLYYWVRTSRQRQGIATRAILAIARFGFESAELSRIEIVVDVDNAASLRAAEKAGAVREGVLRNRLMASNGPRDAVMFSLVPRDLGLA